MERESGRGSRPSWLGPAVLVLASAAIGVLGVLVYRQRTAPAPGAAVVVPVDAGSAPPAAAPEESAPPLAPAGVRALLEPASSDPLFRSCLAREADPIRGWAVVTDNVAEGVSPAKHLAALAPSGPFSVIERDGRSFIAPGSYARYDRLADAVASLDAGVLARAYRRLHGQLQAAYRALGYPGASLDAVTARALRRIEGAPVQDGDVEVVGERGIFTFADRRLEQLPAVEKHLLRMGPRNARLVQAKAKELREALGL